MSPPGTKGDSGPGDKNEELCKPECKVAKSFLELFKLLEEYGPTWYTFEHHNRAATAKLLLDSSVLHDSAREEEGPDHLELHYACKILFLAVHTAIGSDRPAAQRLLNCYVELSSLDLGHRLPADLRQRFDAMISALSCAEDPSKRQKDATATIAKMDDQEVRSWLDEILNLLVEANRRHSRAESP